MNENDRNRPLYMIGVAAALAASRLGKRVFLAEAQGLVAEEEWRATKFYDSPTRTRRSAVSAYEKYLAENPDSVHTEEAKARLAELKEGSK